MFLRDCFEASALPLFAFEAFIVTRFAEIVDDTWNFVV